MDWQVAVVALIVLLAAFYLARRYLRVLRGHESGCHCEGGCQTGPKPSIGAGPDAR